MTTEPAHSSTGSEQGNSTSEVAGSSPAALATHSPLPWGACQKGDCPCGQIWTKPGDHPVANVTSGPWGDTYPSIRIVGENSFDRKAEAFIERIDYGEVDTEVAKENAKLIVRAVNSHDALVKALTDARKAIASLGMEALGYASAPNNQAHWPIRDELLSRIDTALKDAE